ncbi:MAG TPA: hypothetical protein VKB24_00070 [Candidatus Acidoferrum sp.]|nr:hypothetical protein [Candidatus Acidoferrum sp.]
MKILALRLAGIAVLSVAVPFLAGRAAAQGPAGAGAAEAAAASSGPHSYNPTKWFAKKEGKPGTASSVPVEQLDQNLEPKLRAAQVLGGNASLQEVCRNFIERLDCVAALHAGHNLGLEFVCLKANMTGVRTDVDAGSCHMPSDDKRMNLAKAIHFLKSDADSKRAAKEAEAAALEEIKDAASQGTSTASR